LARGLEDYERETIESLSSEIGNFSNMNDSITKLILAKGKHRYHVHSIELSYKNPHVEKTIVFYLVPLRTYVKPLRATQSREAILGKYAVDSFKILESTLPPSVQKV
jgi:hypothetical protein